MPIAPIAPELFNCPKGVNIPYRASLLGVDLRNLARFWLKPDWLEQCAEDKNNDEWYRLAPKLPQDRGACWIVFVTDREHPILERGVVLPLQWTRTSQAQRRVPDSVVSLAQNVLEFAREAELIKSHEKFYLDFPVKGNWPNLSAIGNTKDLPLTADSGFISAFVGLWQLIKRAAYQPSPYVWATGSYDPNPGIGDVGDVNHKIVTAARLGATELHLPRLDFTEANLAIAGREGVKLKPLNPAYSPKELVSGLGNLLAASLLEPALSFDDENIEAEIKDASKYQLTLAKLDKDFATAWYKENMWKHLPNLCRKNLAACNFTGHPTHLITIASGNPETIRTTVATFGIKECLILHTDDMLEQAQQAESDCLELAASDLNCNVKLEKVSLVFGVIDLQRYRSQLYDEFQDKVAEFAKQCQPEMLAIDLTPGFTTHKVVFLEGIAKPGNLLIYLQHQMQGRNIIHGTEEYVVWRKGDAWRPD